MNSQDCDRNHPTQRRGGVKTFFKWSAIVCVGLIGLFAIIVAVVSSGSDTPDLPPRIAAATPTPEATHTPVPTPTPVPTFAELKSKAAVVPYDDLFRYNERYVGESVYYRGQVNQVIDQGSEIYVIRVYVTGTLDEALGNWMLGNRINDIFMIYERGDGDRVREGDIIEFVGSVTGLHNYETVQGSQRTIPQLLAIRLKILNLKMSGYAGGTPALPGLKPAPDEIKPRDALPFSG